MSKINDEILEELKKACSHDLRAKELLLTLLEIEYKGTVLWKKEYERVIKTHLQTY